MGANRKRRDPRERRFAHKPAPRIDDAGRLLELLLEDGATDLLIAYAYRDENGVSQVRTAHTTMQLQLLCLMAKRINVDVEDLIRQD